MALPGSMMGRGTTNDNSVNRTKKRLRIVCSSFPYSGHLNPLITIAGALVARKNENEDIGENEVFLVMLSSGVKDIESRCEDLGIKVVNLVTGDEADQERALKSVRRTGKVPFPSLADLMKTPMEEALDSIRPDLILSDFCCFSSQEYAASRNIPLILNWPGPLRSVWDILRPAINADSRQIYFAGGGLFVSYVKFTFFRGLAWANVADLGRFTNSIHRAINCGNSMVLVHSFWGLEQPSYFFHPNIVPVGIIEKQSSNTPDLSQSHPELYSFLQSSKRDERKILLVTTGSIVSLEEWLVQLLWEAFERISRGNISIIWGLKEERQKFLTEEQLNYPAFHFSTWLPQPELLASDYVDGVFTHCGWGGTSECLLGGKPVVALPFCLDQMTNAELLIEARCAIAAAPIPGFNTDVTGRSSYCQPSNDDLGWLSFRERFRRSRLIRVTVEGVVDACERLLTDPRYKRAAQKLRAVGSGPGKGRDFVCDLIEHAGQHGLRHLSESEKSDDENHPRAATHASHLTGHRPLLVTIAMGAFAAASIKAAYSIASKSRSRG